jgi:hypothetical protein
LRLGGSGEAHATVQHLSGMDDDVTSLEFLRKVYRNNDLPLSVRMRAAALAIPFEAPKLAATAYIAEDDFAARLELAIARSAVKVIEHRAEPEPQLPMKSVHQAL